MSIVSSAINAVGNLTASAYLVIKDYRDLAAATNSSSASSLLSSTSSALTSGLDDLVSSVVSDTDKTFEVQFNPSEVQVYVSSLPSKKTDASPTDSGTPKQVADSVIRPTVDLTVTLYFDQVVVADSFRTNTGGITATNVITTGATLVGNTTYTVRPQVEGLLAALRNPYTRSITFRWAEFSFAGNLSMVQSKYTMFSNSGHPVRATVVLRIRQELDVDTMKEWYSSYTSAFTGTASDLSSSIAEEIFNVNI